MFIFLIVIILLIAIMMSVVVLLQSGKGGGLSGIAGGQTTQILGARQAPDLLEKVTWALGGAFLFLSVITTFFTGTTENTDPAAFEQAAEEAGSLPVTPPATELPAAPAPDAAAPAQGGDAAPAESE
ncbi:MAG: preprotein translocase subunit SecG [Bacteroidota bacterium]